MTAKTEPEEPNTLTTALRIWSAGAAIVLTIVVVIPCALVALFYDYFALGGRIGD